MALDNSNNVDAVGIENGTGKVVLTIADGWAWEDPETHLLALQAKLNAYFHFVEGGQLQSAYPPAVGREIVIEIVTRFPLHPQAAELIARAADACRDLEIEIRSRHVPGNLPPEPPPIA